MAISNAVRVEAGLVVRPTANATIANEVTVRRQYDLVEDEPSVSSVVQHIDTSHEALDIADGLTATGVDPGYAYFENMEDAGVSIDVGVEDASNNFIPMIRLKPGEVALMPLATAELFAEADTTGGGRLKHTIVER